MNNPELRKLLTTMANNPAPSLLPMLLPLFKETFYLSENEISEMILKILEVRPGDPRKLGIFGYLNGVSVTIPPAFIDALKTKGLVSALSELPCSLKVENIHLLSEKMRSFIARFYNEFQIPISLNMYITPAPEAPCFKPHSDATEVFIYQLYGEKKWSFFCDHQGHYLAGRDDKAVLSEEEVSKTLRKEVLLKDQDILQVPPMLFHEACAVGGGSIHLTISMNRLRMEHLMRVFETAMLEELQLHKYKNFTNEEFEDVFKIVLEKMNSEKFKEKFEDKKEQMMFLSGSQLLTRGR